MTISFDIELLIFQFISEGLFGHDIIEIFPGDLLAVLSCSLEHLGELVIGHGLSQFLGHFPQIGQIDGIAAILVKQIKYLVNAFLGFLNTVHLPYRLVCR